VEMRWNKKAAWCSSPDVLLILPPISRKKMMAEELIGPKFSMATCFDGHKLEAAISVYLEILRDAASSATAHAAPAATEV
jgi:hypothetical protein